MEAIVRGVLTHEVYCLVNYVHGEEELLTREEVERCFYAKANASAAIWHYAENNVDY